MIILSPEDAELLKMNDLQLAAKVLREGGATSIAEVCERAASERTRMIEALEFYANPDIYKPHPHGLAFDRRDVSFKAKAVLEEIRALKSPPRRPQHDGE